MDIEDDFIEDSDQSEDQSDDEENNIFLTATQGDQPKEIILKPAVNVYPLTTLTQQLLSKMYSLQMFGQSSIGATIPGSVYDLGSHLQKMYNSFPTFVKESNVYSNSRQCAYTKKLDNIKTKMDKIQQMNKKLNERIRNNKRLLPDSTKPKDNNEFTDTEKIKAEMRSNIFALKKAVSKIKEINQSNDQMQLENEQIQKQMNDILMRFKKNYSGDGGQLSRNIVKTEIELRTNVKNHKESLIVAQEIIDSFKGPIQSLETRLADMSKRISAVNRPIRVNRFARIRV